MASKPKRSVLWLPLLLSCSQADDPVKSLTNPDSRQADASSTDVADSPDAAAASPDAGDGQDDAPPSSEPLTGATLRDSSCVPREEECNREDDDCNGKVDDLAPIPCPGGGFRYCVAGEFSECPTRCEVCIPGSERVCFVNYCTYWGVQTCASDGRSWSRCREVAVPGECADVASEHGDSPELERCCIDSDYCCFDQFDQDGDGNRSEVLGRCEQVSCEP